MKKTFAAPLTLCAALAAMSADAGAFELLSRPSGSALPPSASGVGAPSVTPDGRYAVFATTADNLVTPSAAGQQIYLRDRQAGTTVLVSVSLGGVAANAASDSPTISDDGCRVVFLSTASDLVAGDAGGTQDIFVRDRCAQPPATSLVSRTTGGAYANNTSFDARISGDGKRVVFTSYATNLAAISGMGTAISCLFLHDLDTHATTALTTSGNCIYAARPDISENGKRVVFWAYNVPGTTTTVNNGVWQIYLYDFAAAGAITLVSADHEGSPQSAGSPHGEGASTITAPAISPDGGYVAFRSRGGGLYPTYLDGISHVYVKELSTGVIVLASRDSAGTPGNDHSSGAGEGFRPALSRFASSVVFTTIATNLAPQTAGTTPNVIANNPYTGATVGFSDHTMDGMPAVSSDGRYLAAHSSFALDPNFPTNAVGGVTAGYYLFGGVVRYAATATDFNANGRSDLLYRNSTTGQVFRILMDGTSVSSARLAYSEPNLAWKIIHDADFNGDGIADALWRNTSTGQLYYQPYGGNGLPNGGVVFYTEPNSAWTIVQTPDLDGDGKADLVWWNSTTGQVYGMRMDGGSILAQGLFHTEPNLAWKIVASGDFAGSGKTNQLVWRNSSTGQVYLMTVNIAGGVFSATGAMIYTEPNAAWKILGAADFNGDGKSDLLWRNDVTGQVFGMLMNGGAILAQGLIYTEPNLAWKIVAQGDYDGDGKADLLWRNQSTGQVYMFLMSGLASTSQVLVYNEPNVAWKLLGPWEYSQP